MQHVTAGQLLTVGKRQTKSAMFWMIQALVEMLEMSTHECLQACLCLKFFFGAHKPLTALRYFCGSKVLRPLRHVQQWSKFFDFLYDNCLTDFNLLHAAKAKNVFFVLLCALRQIFQFSQSFLRKENDVVANAFFGPGILA